MSIFKHYQQVAIIDISQLKNEHKQKNDFWRSIAQKYYSKPMKFDVEKYIMSQISEYNI